jgi:hypothetical protein
MHRAEDCSQSLLRNCCQAPHRPKNRQHKADKKTTTNESAAKADQNGYGCREKTLHRAEKTKRSIGDSTTGRDVRCLVLNIADIERGFHQPDIFIDRTFGASQFESGYGGVG